MSEGILGSHSAPEAGIYEVYEAPVGKYVKCNISVNSDTPTYSEVVLYVTSGGSPTNTDTIQVDTLRPRRSGYERSAIILKAGEKIFYKTDSANTDVIVTGVEYGSAGEVFSVSAVSTLTESVEVYEVGGSDTAAVNLSVSLLGLSSLDRADIEVYITKTDIASGYKLQKSNLRRASVSGFVRFGFVLSSGDKIIIATSDVVGGVAIRAHGFRRSVS